MSTNRGGMTHFTLIQIKYFKIVSQNKGNKNKFYNTDLYKGL